MRILVKVDVAEIIYAVILAYIVLSTLETVRAAINRPHPLHLGCIKIQDICNGDLRPKIEGF